MMRISTAGMHQLAVNGMLKQQVALSRTQEQVASGKRVNSPADDPVAAVQLQELTRLQAQHEQYDKNSVAATGRLQLEEQSLADSINLLQRVRDLVVQANSTTLSDSDRQSIATELKTRLEELQGIANRRDSGGDYLFAGLSARTLPFAGSGSVAYQGDSGSRLLQIDAAVAVQDADAGDRVFMNITQGNGVFTTAAGAGNSGSGSIDAGSVTTLASWVSDDYTLSFTTATAWQITDSAANVVATGSFSSGSAISFRGVQVSVSGTPAAGDSFSIDAAGTEDIFTTLSSLIDSLSQPSQNDAARARLNTALGGSLQQLDQALDHLQVVRTDVGTRLTLLDDVQSTRESRLADIETSISNLQDLDYAAAVSKLNQQSVSLQAAQQSFAAISGLSLFDYL